MGKHVCKVNWGKVSTTQNQYKKHYSQMNSRELKYLVNKVKSIRHYQLSTHLLEKIDLGLVSFDLEQVERLLNGIKQDMIIEYNYNQLNHSRRVLIRDNKSVEVKVREKDKCEIRPCNLCLVVDIDSHIVITGYYAYANDNHATLDWSRYSRYLKIL